MRLEPLAAVLAFFIFLAVYFSGSFSQARLEPTPQIPSTAILETTAPTPNVLPDPDLRPPQIIHITSNRPLVIIPIDSSPKALMAYKLLCTLRQLGGTRDAEVVAYVHPVDLPKIAVPPELVLYQVNRSVDKACMSLTVPLHALEQRRSVFWLEPTHVVASNPFYPPPPHELTLSTTDTNHPFKGRRRQHPDPCPEKATTLNFYSAHPTINAINTLRRADFACRHPESKQHAQPEAAVRSAVHEFWLISEHRVAFGCYDAGIFHAAPTPAAPKDHFKCQTCPGPDTGKVTVDPVLYRSSALSQLAAAPPHCPTSEVFVQEQAPSVAKRTSFAASCLGKAFFHLDTAFLNTVSDAEFQAAFDKAVRGTDYLRGRHIHKFTHGGWGGPWIDDLFISNLSQMPASFFRPIIPLFINWQDYMQQHDKSADLWETLELIIDPRFPYITVNQHDCGNDRLTNSYPNVIVLSSGGYGHIALPLVRGERPTPSIKPQQRARNIFWKGEEAFHHRAKALHVLRQHFNVTAGTKNYEKDLTQHVFGFAGRGHGRTSFRLMELIQSGTIPLYIYDDVPWMPYHPKVDWNRFALSASLTQLDELVRRIKELQANVTATTAMHDFMLARRRSHFTNEGVIFQINRLFIDPPTSDLVCQPLPYWGGTDLWPPKCLAVRGWRWEEWRTPENIDRW